MTPVIDTAALVLVSLTAVYFLVLGSAAVLTPGRATRFLLSFAATPGVHYAEMAARLAVGGSLVVHAPHMLAARAVGVFGWVILLTTAGLLLVPWRWHHRFAQRVVPPAMRFIAGIGVACLALGGFLVASLVLGPEAGP